MGLKNNEDHRDWQFSSSAYNALFLTPDLFYACAYSAAAALRLEVPSEALLHVPNIGLRS